MIYYVGKSIVNSSLFFTTSTFDKFVEWITPLQAYQHDLESTVTESIVERKMTLAQYGSLDGAVQWVLDIRSLTQHQAIKLCAIMNNPLQIKLIHNVSFEYQLWKKYGVILSNVQDTMLMEKVKWCGYTTEAGFYSLAGLCERYLGVYLDKSLQTSFGSDSFTIEQIFYAADDVKYLGHIRRLQLYYDGDEVPSLVTARLLNVVALENEVVCAFSEIEYNGMRLDIDAWRANIDLAQPVIDEAAAKLDGYLRSNEFSSAAIELGYLTDKDELAINWNSTLDKKKVFNKVYPHLTGITKPIITKYLKTNLQEEDDTEERLALFAYLERDYDTLNNYLLDYHGQWLLDNNLLIPANTSKISWTSGKQVLTLLQHTIAPRLKSVSKESLSTVDHPLISAYQEFLNTTKLKTTYGEDFITKYVDSDGKVRTHFNQILNTGRVSSSNPNLQNIPAKGSIGPRYRNCFISDPGWLVCSSDYASQELILIAFFSQDKVWLDALSKDKDLHSVVAEVVFKDKWKNGAENDCLFYAKDAENNILNQKCKCKEHKKLRELIKTINYMLAYGGGPKKFSSVAKISLQEAKDIIKEYFATFPGIKGILDAFANYGVTNGYILTAKPFNRRRYYDYWANNRHDDGLMSQISRASQNSPGCMGEYKNKVNCWKPEMVISSQAY